MTNVYFVRICSFLYFFLARTGLLFGRRVEANRVIYITSRSKQILTMRRLGCMLRIDRKITFFFWPIWAEADEQRVRRTHNVKRRISLMLVVGGIIQAFEMLTLPSAMDPPRKRLKPTAVVLTKLKTNDNYYEEF